MTQVWCRLSQNWWNQILWFFRSERIMHGHTHSRNLWESYRGIFVKIYFKDQVVSDRGKSTQIMEDSSNLCTSQGVSFDHEWLARENWIDFIAGFSKYSRSTFRTSLWWPGMIFGKILSVVADKILNVFWSMISQNPNIEKQLHLTGC